MPAWITFDWETITGFRRHHLPHVTQAGAVYFITFRLGDSIPVSRVASWKSRMEQWRVSNPRPHNSTQREMLKAMGFRRVEKYLNGGDGSCLLRHTECRHILAATLRHEDGRQYHLGDYVIMPNHVHVILKALGSGDLSAIIGDWKSVSAHRINKLLQRKGSMWQDEWFDHIIRSPASLERVRQYIHDNPRRLPADSASIGCGAYK